MFDYDYWVPYAIISQLDSTRLGHQDSITSIDALTRERAVTSGGRDISIRLWKIPDESQLVFNGHGGSIDCVRFVNEEHFVSCGDDGYLSKLEFEIKLFPFINFYNHDYLYRALSLWGSMKKKPLCSVTSAHGICATNNLPNWISAVAALPNTDLVASGTHVWSPQIGLSFFN